jgi:hypothetical protein
MKWVAKSHLNLMRQGGKKYDYLTAARVKRKQESIAILRNAPLDWNEFCKKSVGNQVKSTTEHTLFSHLAVSASCSMAEGKADSKDKKQN